MVIGDLKEREVETRAKTRKKESSNRRKGKKKPFQFQRRDFPPSSALGNLMISVFLHLLFSRSETQ